MDIRSPPVDIGSVLAQSRFFAGWPQTLLDTLGAQSRVCVFANGEHVLTAGVPSDDLVVIAKGSLIARRVLKNGKIVVFGYLTAGQVTAHLAVLDGEPPALDAIANGAAEVILIPGKVFREAISSHPALMMDVIQSLCRRTRLDYEGTILRVGNSTRCAIAKMIGYVARTAEVDAEGGYRLQIGITQDQIAAQIGCTRQTVNREIARMVREGILSRPYGRIHIRDLSRLIAIIEAEDPAPPEILALVTRQPPGVLKGGD